MNAWFDEPELSIPCPTCSARAGEDCRRFGYCPARSKIAGDPEDSDIQPDPYIDPMAGQHEQEYEPSCCELPRNHRDWPDDPGCQVSTVC